MAATPPISPHGVYCPHCGYDLRATTAGRCPECGAPFDFNDGFLTQIPWCRRRVLGSFTAYLRTLWWLYRLDPRLAHEGETSADWASATRFRWVSVLLFAALIPLCDLMLRLASAATRYNLYEIFPRSFPPDALWPYPFRAALTGPYLPATLLIASGLAGALASWMLRFIGWMACRGQSNRLTASALACYTTAYSASLASLGLELCRLCSSPAIRHLPEIHPDHRNVPDPGFLPCRRLVADDCTGLV